MTCAIAVSSFAFVPLASTPSGAADVPSSSVDSRAQGRLARVSAPDRCPSTHKALRYYTARYVYWTKLRSGTPKLTTHPRSRCPRYLVNVRRAKAAAAHRAWDAYFHYHYAWSEWLPDKWQRIGACETGYGRRPGNWRHSNSSYEGAFGFAKSSWDSFKYRADRKAGPYPEDAWQATPRQQYEVALAIWRAYGFSGWGCRGA